MFKDSWLTDKLVVEELIAQVHSNVVPCTTMEVDGPVPGGLGSKSWGEPPVHATQQSEMECSELYTPTYVNAIYTCICKYKISDKHALHSAAVTGDSHDCMV